VGRLCSPDASGRRGEGLLPTAAAAAATAAAALMLLLTAAVAMASV